VLNQWEDNGGEQMFGNSSSSQEETQLWADTSSILEQISFYVDQHESFS